MTTRTKVETTGPDGTRVVKLLVDFAAGGSAEVSAIRRADKNIVCFSTQVGCPIGCAFCVSGHYPYLRNLSRDEMRSLVRAALGELPGGRLVLSAMGEGEPAYNADAVLDVLAGFRDGDTRLALSTSAPKPVLLRRLLDGIDARRLPVKIQFSLHLADAAERRAFMPGGGTPPAEAVATIAAFAAVRPYLPRPEFNVALIDGVNDDARRADAVADLLASFDPAGYLVKVNAFNPIAESGLVPSRPERVAAFLARLDRRGVPYETYATDGAAIGAACGQLHHAGADAAQAPGFGLWTTAWSVARTARA